MGWAIWSNWQVFGFFYFINLFSLEQQGQDLSCSSSAEKVYIRLCYNLLQYLFFLAFVLSQTPWFGAQVPKLLFILSSDLNSCQLCNGTNTTAWWKDDYLPLWLSCKFCRFCSTCTSYPSFIVFRKQTNQKAFVALNK